MKTKQTVAEVIRSIVELREFGTIRITYGGAVVHIDYYDHKPIQPLCKELEEREVVSVEDICEKGGFVVHHLKIQ